MAKINLNSLIAKHKRFTTSNKSLINKVELNSHIISKPTKNFNNSMSDIAEFSPGNKSEIIKFKDKYRHIPKTADTKSLLTFKQELILLKNKFVKTENFNNFQGEITDFANILMDDNHIIKRAMGQIICSELTKSILNETTPQKVINLINKSIKLHQKDNDKIHTLARTHNLQEYYRYMRDTPKYHENLKSSLACVDDLIENYDIAVANFKSISRKPNPIESFYRQKAYIYDKLANFTAADNRTKAIEHLLNGKSIYLKLGMEKEAAIIDKKIAKLKNKKPSKKTAPKKVHYNLDKKFTYEKDEDFAFLHPITRHKSKSLAKLNQKITGKLSNSKRIMQQTFNVESNASEKLAQKEVYIAPLEILPKHSSMSDVIELVVKNDLRLNIFKNKCQTLPKTLDENIIINFKNKFMSLRETAQTLNRTESFNNQMFDITEQLMDYPHNPQRRLGNIFCKELADAPFSMKTHKKIANLIEKSIKLYEDNNDPIHALGRYHALQKRHELANARKENHYTLIKSLKCVDNLINNYDVAKSKYNSFFSQCKPIENYYKEKAYIYTQLANLSAHKKRNKAIEYLLEARAIYSNFGMTKELIFSEEQIKRIKTSKMLNKLRNYSQNNQIK